MPRPRFERAAPDRRDALLDAAAREFARHGYDGASINRILMAARFSKGSFYYYFDDKADLAAAVLEREVGAMMASWSTLVTPGSADEFWAELGRLAKVSIAQMRQAPESADALSRLGTAIARNPGLLERIAGPSVREATEKLAAFWQRGQEVGAVRDDLPVGTLLGLLESIKLAAAGVLLPADRAPSAEEFAGFVRIHLDLVRRVSEAKARP